MTIVPASIRNKNPGAIYPGPSAKRFGAASHEVLNTSTGRYLIATFPTHVHGAAGLFHNLMNAKRRGSYYYRGKTIAEAIATWCDKLHAAEYTKLLVSRTGISADAVLTEERIKDAAWIIPLAKAMARHEAGRDYPLDDAGWQEAHRMAFAGAVAPAWTPENDVPSPRPETRAAEARGWWVRVTGWSSAAVTAVVGAVEPLYRGALDVLANLTELAPIKSAFVEAGANARAIGLGVLAAAIFAALGKMLGKEE